MGLGILGEGGDVVLLPRVVFCLLCDDVSNNLRVLDVVLPAHERPDNLNDLLVKHVIEEPIRSHNENVVMGDIMDLSVCLLRVITSSSDLERKVEAVGLLLRTEHRNHVSSRLAHEKVARVAQVACVEHGSFFVERYDHTC